MASTPRTRRQRPGFSPPEVKAGRGPMVRAASAPPPTPKLNLLPPPTSTRRRTGAAASPNTLEPRTAGGGQDAVADPSEAAFSAGGEVRVNNSGRPKGGKMPC
jgi:hypothetical protein